LTGRMPALVYFAWSLTYLWLLKQGHYQNFMRPDLWPLMIFGLLLALIFLGGTLLDPPASATVQFPIQRWLSGIILLIPLLFVQAANNQTLGSYALHKRTFNLNKIDAERIQATPTPSILPDDYGEVAVGQGLQFSTEPGEFSLLEILRYSEQISGHRLITQGMVHRGAKTPAGHFVLFQFVISCCVADSQPVSILVKSEKAETFYDNQWVRIEGTLKTARGLGIQRLLIIADKVEPISTPPVKKRYLYFF